MLTGQHVSHRDLEGDLPRKAVDTASRRSQTNARFRQAKTSVIGRDDDVAGQRHLEPTAESKAVDRGDQRLPHLGAVGDAAKSAFGPGAAGHTLFGSVLEVVAGRESFIAGASKNNYPDVVISDCI